MLCDAVKKDYVQFGQQCCRENEGEDIWGSTIEKLCRGDQNRLIDESSVDLTLLLTPLDPNRNDGDLLDLNKNGTQHSGTVAGFVLDLYCEGL